MPRLVFSTALTFSPLILIVLSEFWLLRSDIIEGSADVRPVISCTDDSFDERSALMELLYCELLVCYLAQPLLW